MENKIIKFIAIYARVSTLLQEVQETINNQLIYLREYATKNGYIIVAEYVDDGWSGDILERPGLDQLREDARLKKWDAVLIYDPDRLARKYAYQELVIDEFNQREIPIIFTTVSPPKDDMERAMLGMRGVFAEFEKAKIRERFRMGKLRKVKGGHILTTQPLYGYDYISNKYLNGKLVEHGYLVINKEEARVVGMIFDWIGNLGMTLRAVVRKLQELGIKPRKSKKGVWNTSTLSTMLKHEGYIGRSRWGSSYAVIPEKPLKNQKYKRIKKTSRKFRPKSEWHIIPIPRLIEDDLFWKTRARLEQNFSFADRNKKNDYLLSGLIWCTCGRRRCGCSPMGGKHLYYRCNDRIHCFPLPPQCSEKGINARIADKLVWEKVSKLMSSEDLLMSQLDRWIGLKIKGSQNSAINMEEIKNLISGEKVKENRYKEAYGKGLFEIEELRNYLTPIHAKIASLEAQLTSAEGQKSLEIGPDSIDKAELATFATLVKKSLQGLSFAVKRAIVMDTVEKVVATQEKLEVYGYIPINQNVSFCSKHRNSRITKCGEEYPF